MCQPGLLFIHCGLSDAQCASSSNPKRLILDIEMDSHSALNVYSEVEVITFFGCPIERSFLIFLITLCGGYRFSSLEPASISNTREPWDLFCRPKTQNVGARVLPVRLCLRNEYNSLKAPPIGTFGALIARQEWLSS
jgi:hypothetical protein